MLSELRMEVNKTCNYDCVHCYTDKRPYERLTMDQIRALLADAVAAGATDLSLTGGEPLLEWRHVRDIATEAQHQRLRVRLNTNGHLLSATVVEALAPLIAEFQVSLNSAGRKNFDAFVRRDNAFEKVITGIQRLTAAGSYVTVRFTLMGETAPHLLTTFALCEQLGVRGFKVRTVVPAGPVVGPNDGALSAIRAAASALFEAAIHSTVAVRFSDSGAGVAVPTNQANVASPPCRCGTESLFVGADGKVAACVFLRDYPNQQLGDVNTQSIAQIYNSSSSLKEFVHGAAAASCSRGGGCFAAELCARQAGAESGLVTLLPPNSRSKVAG
jgi:MoaA/NifB/PqqE/SkfB family radical SAM enzyme